MLPTPIAGDWKGQRRADGTASMLSGKASLGLLPTPRVGGQEDYETRKKRQGHEKAMSYLEANIQFQTGSNSQLNPQFVAEMMGFPTDWTLLPFLNGETSQSKHTETQ